MPSHLAPLLEELRDLRPDGTEAIDAHTHLGLGEDGLALSACRDPSPGDAGAVLHRLAPLLEGAARAIGRPEGLEEATELLHPATAVAATEPSA